MMMKSKKIILLLEKNGLFLEKTMKPIYNNYFRDILDYSLPHSTSPFISSPLLLKVLKTRV